MKGGSQNLDSMLGWNQVRAKGRDDDWFLLSIVDTEKKEEYVIDV